MSALVSVPTEYDELDRLCRIGEFKEAIERARALLRHEPLDRLARLYELLNRLVLYGPDVCAAEIGALRSFTELSDAEKNVVRKILMICYDAAERQQDTELMWTHQRLLRHLLLNQSLEMPVAPVAAPTPVREKSFSWPVLKELGDSLFNLARHSTARLKRTIVQYLDTPIAARPGPLMFTLALLTVVAVIIIFVIIPPKPEEKSSARVVSAPPTSAAPATLNVTIAELIAKTNSAELHPFDKRDLRQWIEDKLPSLNLVYASRLKEIAGLAGEITVEIAIDASGNINRMHEDSSNLVDVSLQRSIVEEIGTWRFPNFDRGPIVITLQLLFSNGESLSRLPATEKSQTSVPSSVPPEK